MDFALTTEQEAIIDATRRMVKTEILPVLRAHDPDKSLPKEAALRIIKAGATLGITGAMLPESAGGSALRALDYGLIYEQLPLAAAFILQPHEACARRIYYGSSPEQRERFLPALLAGRKVGGSAITEPDVGSDARSVKTAFTRERGYIVINGRKTWLCNATVCDVLNVTGQLKEEGKPPQLARVLLDRAESPFTTEEIQVIGIRQAYLGEALFDNCRVREDNLCGQSGDAARVMNVIWLTNRPMLGLGAVNMAQQALNAAKEYAGVRKQFGRHIGGFQLVQQDLADIETLVTASRLLCYNALAAIDRGERANGLGAMAKRFAVESCDRAIALAMRVHGAMGLSKELGLEQFARDVRMLSIPDGTPGILALIQGRELTGISAFRG